MPLDPAVRREVLSCLLLGFPGTEPPPWLLDALADGLGGVVLFAENVGDGSETARLSARLRAAAGRDVVVAIDEEGGEVTRFDAARGSSSPGAAPLGFLDDVAATEADYARTAARCAEAGVTVDLAPVADVNVDPLNPVIGLRAFSDDPAACARHVAAAVRGIQSAGVAACLKHFPGHGATRTDSHLEVAVLDRTRTQFEQVEFVPFRAGVAAGARAVMTAHVAAAALDADHLATVSPAITTGVLRDELGFTGTVVTDALDMRALAGTLGTVEGFLAAIAAGADTAEIGRDDHRAFLADLAPAAARALDDGRLTRERLRAAAARTAQLAAAPPPGATRAAAGADAPAVAARCLELLGSLPTLSAPLVVECRTAGGSAAGAQRWSLGARLAGRLPGTQVVQCEAPIELPHDRSVVVVVRDPHRHAWQRELVRALGERADAAVVDVGWPAGLDTAVPVLRTRGTAAVLLDAAAELLAGATPARQPLRAR